MSKRPQPSARMMDTYTERDMAGTAGIHLCLFSPISVSAWLFIISISIASNQQNNNQFFFFFYLLQQNILQTSEKPISLSMLSCLTALSDLTLGRPTLLFTFFFDLKTTHTMSVSIYE